MQKPPLRCALCCVAVLAMAAQLVGCGSIPNAFEKMYPTYEETASAWPGLPSGAGRVVVFWPSVQGQGSMQAPVSAMLAVDNDKAKLTRIASGMFVFADLTAGTHYFVMTGNKVSMPLVVSAGKTTYLQVFIPQLESTNKPFFSISIANFALRNITASEALESLKPLHHEYKKPVPFTGPHGLAAM